MAKFHAGRSSTGDGGSLDGSMDMICTRILATPTNGVVFAQCSQCGTSDPIPVKADSEHREFTCRTCGHVHKKSHYRHPSTN